MKARKKPRNNIIRNNPKIIIEILKGCIFKIRSFKNLKMYLWTLDNLAL